MTNLEKLRSMCVHLPSPVVPSFTIVTNDKKSKRFLKNEEIYHLDGYSDYYDQNFGRSFGVLMEEPRVLARAVFVADWNGILHYAEVVPEITQEPDYESPINILRDLVVNAPGAQMEEPVINDSLPTES